MKIGIVLIYVRTAFFKTLLQRSFKMSLLFGDSLKATNPKHLKILQIHNVELSEHAKKPQKYETRQRIENPWNDKTSLL